MWRKIVIIIAVILVLAGLGFVLFAPVSNFVGSQVSKGQTEKFDRLIENVVTEEQAEQEGKAATYKEAREKGEIDSEGYLIETSTGRRISSYPVVYELDLDRLYRDSVAYNEDLKENQGSKFREDESNDVPVLDLRDYGLFDGIYGYISAPTIGMYLPIYLGASDANMSYGAAHMSYTSLPLGGARTNSVAAGHTGYIGRIFFDNIRYLDYGDKIFVKNFWYSMTYKVVDKQIYRPDESQAIFLDKDRDLFTMFTCVVGEDGNSMRYFVICERDEEEQTQPPTTVPATQPVTVPGLTEEASQGYEAEETTEEVPAE